MQELQFPVLSTARCMQDMWWQCSRCCEYIRSDRIAEGVTLWLQLHSDEPLCKPQQHLLHFLLWTLILQSTVLLDQATLHCNFDGTVCQGLLMHGNAILQCNCHDLHSTAHLLTLRHLIPVLWGTHKCRYLVAGAPCTCTCTYKSTNTL